MRSSSDNNMRDNIQSSSSLAIVLQELAFNLDKDVDGGNMNYYVNELARWDMLGLKVQQNLLLFSTFSSSIEKLETIKHVNEFVVCVFSVNNYIHALLP
jgi:hypothetical protein